MSVYIVKVGERLLSDGEEAERGGPENAIFLACTTLDAAYNRGSDGTESGAEYLNGRDSGSCLSSASAQRRSSPGFERDGDFHQSGEPQPRRCSDLTEA